MDIHDQQAAIAKFLGYKHIEKLSTPWNNVWECNGKRCSPPPRYPFHKDDMLEAKKRLSVDQGVAMIAHLWKLVAQYETTSFSPCAAFLLTQATPAQESEAFLKAVNLWTT
jgi:hypothetical protein